MGVVPRPSIKPGVIDWSYCRNLARRVQYGCAPGVGEHARVRPCIATKKEGGSLQIPLPVRQRGARNFILTAFLGWTEQLGLVKMLRPTPNSCALDPITLVTFPATCLPR